MIGSEEQKRLARERFRCQVVRAWSMRHKIVKEAVESSESHQTCKLAVSICPILPDSEQKLTSSPLAERVEDRATEQ